jgi:hypothetical protein
MQKVRGIVGILLYIITMSYLFTLEPRASEPRIVLEDIGCYQEVTVRDGHIFRRLRREEQMLLGPGSGFFGPWVEVYCPPPNVDIYSYSQKDWPKRITESEVEHLLGTYWYNHFNRQRRAVVSEQYNMTNAPYRGKRISKHRET